MEAKLVITILRIVKALPYFVGLAYQGKVIVFRFIIEYSCLLDFAPWVTSLFSYEDF